jgi:alkaline phosphatase
MIRNTDDCRRDSGKDNRLSMLASILGFALAGLFVAAPALAGRVGISNQHEVKYVILMVPDGMNLSSVTAARIKLNGIKGTPLYLETLERVGYQRTYSEKNTVTDSSAAASAWACGEKFVNNEVCAHMDGRPNNLSLLELASNRGMSTGLVATQTITHATPASFGAHVRTPPSSTNISPRDCQSEIARQYVRLTQPDVLLGGGRLKFAPPVPDLCGAGENYINVATGLGYTYVSDASQIAPTVAKGPKRLLGLFSDDVLKETRIFLERLHLEGTARDRDTSRGW